MTERTDYIARTAAGVTIATFAERRQAMAWADTEGAKFPGHSVVISTEVTRRTERVLRRDRSHLQVVA